MIKGINTSERQVNTLLFDKNDTVISSTKPFIVTN